jgi:hypothetical protein
MFQKEYSYKKSDLWKNKLNPDYKAKVSISLYELIKKVMYYQNEIRIKDRRRIVPAKSPQALSFD